MASMDNTQTSRVYDLWARVYDSTFGRLVDRRQRCAQAMLGVEPGHRILDLGVGTGATLLRYPATVTVVGLDLSGGMLSQARRKVLEQGLRPCHLVQGDAMLPPLREGSFDRILISHTVSVVPEPEKLMAWACRLLKPGGSIVLLNHFLSQSPVIGWFEHVLNPFFVRIGWRSDLALEACLEGSGLHVHDRFRLSRVDFWQLVVLRAEPPAAAVPQRAPWRPEAERMALMAQVG